MYILHICFMHGHVFVQKSARKKQQNEMGSVCVCKRISLKFLWVKKLNMYDDGLVRCRVHCCCYVFVLLLFTCYYSFSSWCAGKAKCFCQKLILNFNLDSGHSKFVIFCALLSLPMPTDWLTDAGFGCCHLPHIVVIAFLRLCTNRKSDWGGTNPITWAWWTPNLLHNTV